MGWIIGFLTFILVLDCLFLILLILIQLPKKEAGIGQAFGGAATDALFGAGSGTALTKLTKYATGFFLAVTMLLTVLNAHQVKNRDRGFEESLNQAAKSLPAPAPPPSATTNAAASAASSLSNLVASGATNAAATVTNAATAAASNAAAAATAVTNLLLTSPTDTNAPKNE